MQRKLILLILAMVVILTACGPKAAVEGNDHRQEITEETEKNREDEETDLPLEAEFPEASQAEIPEQEETASEFSKGTVSESGWESQWLNMRFTAPNGTRMASEEELDELMGISEELLLEDLSDVQIKYAELTSVREMMCYDERTKSNVIVSVDRLPLKMSEEIYAEQLEQSLLAVSAMTYEKAGENEKVEIAGMSYLRSGYQVETMGQHLHTDYYIRMIEDRAVSIVLTYGENGEELASSMVSSFEVY
ncbi:MAG: hypothetical protein K2N82_01365 [Lachnospiraceae bacterium]|nr:hypothetical protein [Lachnospiraceae bacterium]